LVIERLLYTEHKAPVIAVYRTWPFGVYNVNITVPICETINVELNIKMIKVI